MCIVKTVNLLIYNTAKSVAALSPPSRQINNLLTRSIEVVQCERHDSLITIKYFCRCLNVRISYPYIQTSAKIFNC